MLFAFILLSQGASMIFISARQEAPAGFETLNSFAQLYALGYWLHADSLRRNFEWPYCRGVFVYAAGLLIVPYYLFKTRGARAFLTLSILVGMHLFASMVGALAVELLISPGFNR